jgi:hypothetical protein
MLVKFSKEFYKLNQETLEMNLPWLDYGFMKFQEFSTIDLSMMMIEYGFFYNLIIKKD